MVAAFGLLHSLVPGHGTWATLAEVGLFLGLLSVVFGIVLVHDDGLEGRRRLAWLLVVVALPLVGTAIYLVRGRRGR